MSFTSYSLALGSKQLRESEDQQTLRVQTLKINNERAIYKSINQSQKYKSKSQKYKSKSPKSKSTCLLFMAQQVMLVRFGAVDLVHKRYQPEFQNKFRGFRA